MGGVVCKQGNKRNDIYPLYKAKCKAKHPNGRATSERVDRAASEQGIFPKGRGIKSIRVNKNEETLHSPALSDDRPVSDNFCRLFGGPSTRWSAILISLNHRCPMRSRMGKIIKNLNPRHTNTLLGELMVQHTHKYMVAQSDFLLHGQGTNRVSS